MNMRSAFERSILSILVFTLVTFHSFARDNITPSQPLAYGEILVSASGTFALGFFSPKNTANKYIGIWFNKIPVQTVVWVANRQRPITNNATRLTITLDGTLVITDHNSTIIWSAASTIVGNPIAQLLDTGNFVVLDAESSSTANGFGWQSFDYPTDTQLPGMKLGWDLKTGTNRNLTSWKSESDPSPGPFCLATDRGGGHEVTQFNGPKIVWRSGMWNGIAFSRIPDLRAEGDLRTNGDYLLTFVNNTDEIYVSYQIGDLSTFGRVHMNYNGNADRYVWVKNSDSWDLIDSLLRGRCDPYRICGPNAYCNPSSLPLCQCFDGFVPKSPGNWALTDASDGCIRKTALACADGTDGFMKISNMALPEVLTAKIDASMSLDECRANCLRDCSCTGYANSNIRGSASGCVIWVAELTNMQLLQDAGQDLYIRLAAADLGKRSTVDNFNKRRQTTIAVTASLVLGSLMLSYIIYFVWKKKKTIRKDSWNEDEDLELPLYDLDTVLAATDNFSTENKLGEGGFGMVYKGKLPGGLKIAVKRLSKTSKQGVDEFKNEVLLIAKLQHRNLVRLLGCCARGENKMLIYEYMPNRSLDAFLFVLRHFGQIKLKASIWVGECALVLL